MPSEMDFITYQDFQDSLEPVETPSESAKVIACDTTEGPVAVPANANALENAATESDMANGNVAEIWTPTGKKKLDLSLVAKASEQTALTTYAQNVAHSIAPEFDPTRDEDHKYLAGESVTYTDGKVYVFKVNHYGPWVAADVESNNTLLAKAAEKHFYSQLVRDVVTTDGKGKQANVNLFEQLIPIPKSTSQYYNKDASVEYNAYIVGDVISSDSRSRTTLFRVPAGKKYCVSVPLSTFNRFNVAIAKNFPNIGDAVSKLPSSAFFTESGRRCVVCDMTDGDTYVGIFYCNTSIDTLTPEELRALIEVCEGEHPKTYESYQFKALTFNGNESLSIEELTAISRDVFDEKIANNGVPENKLAELFDGSEYETIEDVTSSYDMADETGKRIEQDGTFTTSSSYNISEVIENKSDVIYAAIVMANVPGDPAIAYYGDSAGTDYLGFTPQKSPAQYGYLYVIDPRKKYKYFRLNGFANTMKLYKIHLTYDGLVERLNKKISSVSENRGITVTAEVTNEYPIVNNLKSIGSRGELQTSSAGGSTAVYPIDFTKKLCINSAMNQYRTCCAFYADPYGLVCVGIVPIPSGATNVSNLIIDYPVNARYFRLGTTTSRFNVFTFEYVEGASSDVESRLDSLDDSVSALQTSVEDLEESAFLSQVIDTVRAVKLKPTAEIYLGSELWDFSSLVYDSSVWSVDAVNGAISYLGGTKSPIELDVATDSGSSYALQCTQSNYVTQTNTIEVCIGAGFKIDAYNGTNNLFVGAVSDGGHFKIYPMSTSNTFTLSSISVRKKVAQADAVVTKTVTLDNIDNGNLDSTILDGKWNVAIGPVGYTMPKAVSLTRSLAIGYSALALLESGWQNIGIGTFAIDMVKNGNRNIALGCDCLYRITHANDVIALGQGCVQNKESTSWNDPTTHKKVAQWVAIGTKASGVHNGQDVSKSVYIGYTAGFGGVGSDCVVIGAGADGTNGKTNCIVIGKGALATKSNQTVVGNANITETKVYGDLIVEGTDHIKRRIVFNSDNTCSWEAVS